MALATRRARLGALALALVAAPLAVAAQGSPQPEGVMGMRPSDFRIGGHAGIVFPIVGRGNGSTSSIADRVTYGFPVGLTFKPTGPMALDLEVVPLFNLGPTEEFVLLIHPGVLYGFGRRYAGGVRLAYNAIGDNEDYGITPLVSKGFSIGGGRAAFVEVDLPIRRQRPDVGRDFTSVSVALHFGIAF